MTDIRVGTTTHGTNPGLRGRPAALFLACAGLLAAAIPVQGQTAPVWSTTLMVGESSQGNHRGYEGRGTGSENYGMLPDSAFTFSTADYTVGRIDIQDVTNAANDFVSFSISPAISSTAGLILEFAGGVFPLVAEAIPAGPGRNYRWRRNDTTTGLTYPSGEFGGLSVGDTVTVCLRTSSQSCPGPILVSNLGQTHDPGVGATVGTSGSDKFTMAQRFATGSQAGGYTLGSVEVYLRQFGGSDAVRVSIYSSASGNPGSSVHVLTNPSTVADTTVNTFTAPANATLSADTAYFVVVEATAGQFAVGTITSNDEDAGAESGWSIHDSRHWRNSDTGSWSTSAAELRIAVRGPASTPTTTNTAATGTPTISGPPQVGETLKAGKGTIGDADNLPTTTFPDGYSFQWIQVDGGTETDITGATDSTYVPVAADEGKTIKVRVTFTDGGGTEESLTSDAWPEGGNTIVAAKAACPTDVDWCGEMTVGVTGNEFVGFTYGFSGGGYGELTNEVFAVGGKDYDVSLFLLNQQGRFSAAFSIISPNVLPAFGSILEVQGKKFTLSSSSRDGSNTFRFSNSGLTWIEHQKVTLTLKINTPATGEPDISGPPQVGDTLSAGVGGLADANNLPTTFPDDYSFQWFRVDGGTETRITGATDSTYTPVADDQGKQIKVRVGFTDGRGHPEQRTSAAYPSGTDRIAAALTDCPDGAEWCATMTVGTRTISPNTYYGFSSGSPPYGSLDPAMFDPAETGTAYVVEGVNIIVDASDAATLNINLDNPIPRVTEYTVDGVEFAATPDTDGRGNSQVWSSLGSLSRWIVGQKARVSANLPPQLKSATVNGASLRLFYHEDLDTGSVPADTTYTVTVSDTNVDLSDVAIADSVVTLTLATAVTDDTATVTVSYRVPASSAIQDEYDIKAIGLTNRDVTNNTGAANTDATGKPDISGPAQVGKTLTAGTSDIADADGLTNVSYAYQWIRVDEDESNAVDISGETASTYTVVAADKGKRIKVKVTFDDDGDNAEELTSAASSLVMPAAVSNCPTGATNVWCATLTVGHFTQLEMGETIVYATGFGSADGVGSLTPTTFTHQGVTYTVTEISGGGAAYTLTLATSPALPLDGAGLTLHLQKYEGELEVPLSDTTNTTAGKRLYDLVLFVDPNGELNDVPLLRIQTTRRGSQRLHEQPDIGTEVAVRLSKAAANSPVSGTFQITGTAQVGQTVTADISGLVDANGRTKADNGETGYAYTYQWIRTDSDGQNGVNIVGATDGTYTLTADDAGHKVKVAVLFRDDDDYDENAVSGTFPSAGYGTLDIAPRLAACPTGNEWCATLTVGEGIVSGVQKYGYFLSQLGSLDDTSIDATVEVRKIAIEDDASDVVGLTTTADLPLGSVLDLDGTSFTVNASSKQSGTGEYAWPVPSDFGWVVGQKVRASMNRPPILQSATVDGTSLVITFHETLAAASGLANGAFTVKKTPSGGSEQTVSLSGSPSISGATVTLTLATAVASTDTDIKVSYTKPTTGTNNKLEDATGNEVASFTDQTVTNNTGQTSGGTVAFGAAAYSAAEGGAGATVTVTLSPAQSSQVTIPITATPQGGASAGDYSGVPSSVVFAANETSKTFTLTAVDDAVADPGESVRLTFALPQGVTAGTPSTATVTLVDNDGTSEGSIFDAMLTVGNAGFWDVDFGCSANSPTKCTEAMSQHTFSSTDELGEPRDFEIRGLSIRTVRSGANQGERNLLFWINHTRPFRDYENHRLVLVLDGVRFPFRTGDHAADSRALKLWYDTGLSWRRGQTVRVEILDLDPGRGGKPWWEVGDAEAREAHGFIYFPVRLRRSNNPRNHFMQVDYATSDGTAVAGMDYEHTTGTVTLRDTVTVAEIRVPLIDDTVEDSGETFTLTLFDAERATIGRKYATGTIINSEDPGIRVADARATEGSAVAFTVSLSRASSDPVTVAYATSGGTATSGTDFTAASGTLTFGPNETSKTVSVATTVDALDEESETFTLTLSSPTNATLEDATATGTIDNGESPDPVLGVADASAAEGSAVEFTVSLSEASSESVTVEYATSGGTATSGTDFTAASGTLSFAANETSKTVSVATTDDSDDEENETFTLTLSSPTNATLGDSTATGTIEDDDATPLTASFSDVPASHDGSSAFTFTLSFSENVAGLSFRKLRDSAFDVTGGSVKAARRKTEGSDQHWNIEVEPDSEADVVILLPETTGCNATGAICTSDGRKLSQAVSATVAGPDVTAALTARFEDMPASHTGAAFTFGLVFSEDVGGLGFRTLRDDAFDVTGGSVRNARRQEQGSNQRWTITVRPSSASDTVNITLPETTDCNATGAICTDDDRPLSHSLSATVLDAASSSSVAGDAANGPVEDDGVEAALALAAGLTPDDATQALFGERRLTDAEEAALDRLGNRNGSFDLGDVLSWIERCRRGEADCGGASGDAGPLGAAALLAAARRRRTSGRRGGGAPGPRGRTRARRRAGIARYAVVMLFAAITTWSCADGTVGPVGPVAPEAAVPDPGFLTVELAAPAAPAAHRAGGVLLEIEGPGIGAVQARGLELYESTASGRHQVILAGTLETGPLLQFRVPDRNRLAQYRVRVIQVTGEDYGLMDAGRYRAVLRH